MKKNTAFVFILLSGFAAAVVSCKKDTSPEKPLRLSKLFQGDTTRKPVAEITYQNGKIFRIRQPRVSGNEENLLNFTFDNLGRITGFKEINQAIPEQFRTTAITYSGDKIAAVQIFRQENGLPRLLFNIDYDYDDNTVIQILRNNINELIQTRVARYDDAGNITEIKTTDEQSVTTITRKFLKYDSHPNTIADLFFLNGSASFLPPSVNNPEITVTIRNGSNTVTTEELRYEYNTQGLPVKVSPAGSPPDQLIRILEYTEI